MNEQQKQDVGETEKSAPAVPYQPQEPLPSRDAIVRRLASVSATALRRSPRTEINQLRADARACVARLDIDDGSWMPEILHMVHERLAAFLGEEHMRAVPPMFYDDAIRSVAHKAAFGKLPEAMYPPNSLLHRLRDAETELARMKRERDAWRALYECGAS